MKKLTVLVFAIACLSFSATSALAVPPYCGYVCDGNPNTLCHCESTCQYTTCQVCQGFPPFAGIEATPSWMLDAPAADDTQQATQQMPGKDTSDADSPVNAE